MDMVRVFFEKTKEDTSKYFVDRLIWKEEKYRSLQGKYPVISLTLKDCVGLNFKSALSMLCKTIAKEFKRHFEEVRAHIQDPDLLDQFLKYKSGQITYAELVDSLFFLSFILKTVYKQKVILLIDEYDAPVQSGYKNHFYDEIIVLMRGMLSSVMKTNENLQFGLLTGVLRISEESLISGFNNVKVYSVLDQKFSQYFGFTQQEVDAIAGYYGITDKLPEIKEWYDGYQFGKTTIYNPWSILNYVGDGDGPKPYWVSTANNDIIGELFSRATADEINDLEKLYREKSVFTTIDTNVTYKFIEESEVSLLSFLLVTGYLTSTEKVNELGQREVRIPNKEIKGIFQKEIFSGILHTRIDTISFIKAFIEGNPEGIKRRLCEVLTNTVSYFDTHENFYHGLVLGMLVSASDFFSVQSNKEEGYGRFDIRLIPHSKNRKAIIIELKAVDPKRKTDLMEIAKKAIEQIDEKMYHASLKEKCRGIIKVGIAFSKKKVEVLVQGDEKENEEDFEM